MPDIDFEKELSDIDFDAELAALSHSAPSTAAQQARQQADQHGTGYLIETLKNIPRDVVDQGRGAIGMLDTMARATSELGGAIGGRAVEIFGGGTKGYPQGTPNVDTLMKAPGVIAQHYADYFDPDQRALMVREHPVGLALDVAGIKGGLDATARTARAAVPGIVAVAKNPVVRAVGGVAADVATGGRVSSLRNARELAKVIDEIKRPPAAPPISPTPAAPTNTATRPADALMRELLAREPNWRTTDAVPIDAIKRDITKGGSIIEAGESRVGLGERMADLLKDLTPTKLAEAERLARGLRQRKHISARAR